jgi:hypothetical protein
MYYWKHNTKISSECYYISLPSEISSNSGETFFVICLLNFNPMFHKCVYLIIVQMVQIEKKLAIIFEK